MKFATHTKMVAATWRDVELAGSQGTITSVSLPNESVKLFGSNQSERSADLYRMLMAWFGIFSSAVLLGAGYFRYVDAKAEFERSTLNEPLVRSATGVAA
jgi:hypothetical protein